jgi:histidyl-tRNA synthetase
MAAPSRIEPRTLKGFRDWLPGQMLLRERLIDTARRVFRSYGYAPIDTPALEYLEILLGKGGEETDKQLYRFQDAGGRWVGMRFDLTVPVARFVAQHVNELGLPFKRYHVATVWRGENTARGRYREFMQCDFDVIGTRSLAADVEIVLVIHDLLSALGCQDHTISLNHRGVLAGLLETAGLSAQMRNVLRTLDKLGKQGREAVAAELVDLAGTTPQQAEQILTLAQTRGSVADVLRTLEHAVGRSELGRTGVQALADLVSAVRAAGVPEPCLRLDPSIARGLDYYTGTVFETFLNDLPTIGSVCSGGRYDNLAGLFTAQELPGVGASLGLDRLMAALEELGSAASEPAPAPVLVCWFVAERLHDYLRLAARLRQAGLGVELYPEPRRLGQQLKYADRRQCRVAVIVGEDEFARGECQIKYLPDASMRSVPLTDDAGAVIAEVSRLLQG